MREYGILVDHSVEHGSSQEKMRKCIDIVCMLMEGVMLNEPIEEDIREYVI